MTNLYIILALSLIADLIGVYCAVGLVLAEFKGVYLPFMDKLLVVPSEKSFVKKKYQVGQIIKFNDMKYEIIEISPEPHLVLKDGSKHYVMTIKPCVGKWNDVICVSDI